MKGSVLVFSDTHLTPLPDAGKLAFLLKLIGSADNVIVNGDLWDGYLCRIEKMLASSWQPLFISLKEKEAVYLFGNHDSEAACHGLQEAWCRRSAAEFDFIQAGRHFHVEHGHRIVPGLGSHFPLPVRRLGSLVDNVLTGLARERFALGHKEYNQRMREWQHRKLEAGTVLLCGHTHWPESVEEPPFANSGLIRGGYASYLLLENGQVELRKEHY